MSDPLRQVGIAFRDFWARFGRWLEVEQAEFVGGVLDGKRMPVARTARVWIQPHADGEDTYRRSMRLFSGPLFVFDSHRPAYRLARGGIGPAWRGSGTAFRGKKTL